MSIDRFGVSQYTTWDQTFEDDLECYSAVGIRNLELCERKLADDPGRRREQFAAVDEYGFGIATIQPRVHALFPDSLTPAIPAVADRVALYRRTIDLIAAAYPGRQLTLVTVTGGAPAFDYAAAMTQAVESYRELADYAWLHGLRIALEPLSPIYMNTDTFVCTLSGALELIEVVDRPNFGLLLDVWHVWNEPQVEARIVAAGDLIFGVHISDWRRGGPRAQGDRCLPGDGMIDLPSLLSAVERGGYRGAYCLEIFSDKLLPDSLWNLDPKILVSDGLSAFERVWGARADA
jgi:sugar phosphate isomerase/epimerase